MVVYFSISNVSPWGHGHLYQHPLDPWNLLYSIVRNLQCALLKINQFPCHVIKKLMKGLTTIDDTDNWVVCHKRDREQNFHFLLSKEWWHPPFEKFVKWPDLYKLGWLICFFQSCPIKFSSNWMEFEWKLNWNEFGQNPFFYHAGCTWALRNRGRRLISGISGIAVRM